jgi:alkylation response protein AidB-like acyl-CoA dehydrogenase
MSDEEREIQARARELMDTEFIPFEVEAEMNGGELPEDVIERQEKAVREAGFTGINQPKELGGAGYTTFQQVLVQEQVGRVTNGLAWIVDTPAGWFPQVATPDQIERYVKPTIRGERQECYAITEEHAGSDVGAIRATARRDGDEYVLNGVKWHVTSFNVADYLFFQGRLTEGPNAGATALFIVDMDTPGVEVVRVPRYTHTMRFHHAEMRFTDVRVPATNLVGAEDDGMAYAYAWFRYERLMIGARCCGAAERLIDEATAFARERVQFGRPIYDNQGIQFMLADSLTELWGARLMLYETARGIDRGEDLKVQHGHCSMVKLFASEMANRVADRAVQIFGGRGYMREYAAERFYRELRVERIWEGTSEIQRAILADQLAKRGASALAG